MMKNAVIPEPKKIKAGEGRFVLSGQVKCFVFSASSQADYTAGFLADEVKARGGPGLAVEKIEARNGSHSIVIAAERPEPPAGPSQARPAFGSEAQARREGYELTVTREQAAVTASDPASLEMFADMAGEVMELHADSRYFHIGADETFHLGQCERCREFAEKHGKSKLFVDYVNKVGEFIKSRGKTPILWYDYLTNYPKEVDNLSRDFCIMYWEYRMGSWR